MFTKISEVNLSTFIYRLFHEDFSSIIGTNTVAYASTVATSTLRVNCINDILSKDRIRSVLPSAGTSTDRAPDGDHM